MLVIEKEAIVPNPAFIARHPISGAEFRSHTVDNVWRKFNEHCRGNGYPENTREGIVQNICEQMPHICIDVDESMRPTVAQKIANFAHDMANWARAGFPASRAAVEARLPICQACPYWSGETGGTFFGVACARCGCSGLKLAVHTTQCPMNKWGKFEP